jgi:LmbE family N-acetylglucosaminyl deacetylase
LLLATSGDKGSSDLDMTAERLIEIREAEARAAGDVLGLKDVVFLRYVDGELTPSLDLRRDIVRQIRMRQPDTVVTNDPTAFWYGEGYINHPDHRAVAEATFAAVFPAARDRLNFVEQERDEGLVTHITKRLYVAGPVQRTTVVDISDHIETKLLALAEHASQFEMTEENADGFRKRFLDPQAPEDAPRYVENFRVMRLG